MAERTDASRFPRFAPVTYEEADDLTREVFDELTHAPRDNPVLGTFLHNPELMRRQSPLNEFLKQSTCLPPRQREIVILRVAWNCGADYMWATHTERALECGLRADDIDRIRDGAAAPGWSEDDRVLLEAVDELHLTCHATDETWAGLARQFDERQLVEVLVLTGNYRTLAYVMNGVGIRPPAGESPDLPGNQFLFAPHVDDPLSP
jgi:alkylhydroperoxidase family enzyme